MRLAPSVFASLVVGIARMNEIHAAGRVGMKAIVYFESASALALAIGLVVDAMKPGTRMNVEPAHVDGAAVAAHANHARRRGAIDFPMGTCRRASSRAFASGAMPGMFFFALLPAVSLAQRGARTVPFVDMTDIFPQALLGVACIACARRIGERASIDIARHRSMAIHSTSVRTRPRRSGVPPSPLPRLFSRSTDASIRLTQARRHLSSNDFRSADRDLFKTMTRFEQQARG
ncbi:cation:dicarboxylate symporter family transporter [Burkholderia pseudomallei]|uniref:cation:dicarboxylate symporter family transporter n=1 Tax=Burkholderia pseudomallei TaxID=28450 RepID=UPI00050DDC15|nr:cation:dicarboxylase symporter family transporter [Burkholderia pseudomallei]KGC61488.1 dicarboxylate symporter family protein [Burkholderia pseudomallei]